MGKIDFRRYINSSTDTCITLLKWGKTTISNAGISKQVFRKPLGAPAGLG
jgi:hypothetical protein